MISISISKIVIALVPKVVFVCHTRFSWYLKFFHVVDGSDPSDDKTDKLYKVRSPTSAEYTVGKKF